MSRLPPIVTAWCCVALSACGESVAIDRLHGARWELIEELRVGAHDGENALTAIGGLAVAGDSVFIAQPSEHLIRVFDGRGNMVNVIGGNGAGPGEFQRLVSIGLLHDTLYAVDVELRRLTLFSLDGTVLSTLPFQSFQEAVPTILFKDSTAIATVTESDRSLDGGRVLTMWVRRTGEVLDTIEAIPLGPLAVRFPRLSGGRWFGPRIPEVLRDDPLTPFAQSGRVATIDRRFPKSKHDAQFVVTVRALQGDLVYSRRYQYEPVAFDPALADSFVAYAARRAVAAGAFTTPRAAEGAVRKLIEAPAFHAPVSAAMFSADGTLLWINREAVRNPRVWVAHNSQGEIVGTLEVPPHVQLRWIGAGSAVGVEKDQFGVEYLVRFRF